MKVIGRRHPAVQFISVLLPLIWFLIERSVGNKVSDLAKWTLWLPAHLLRTEFYYHVALFFLCFTRYFSNRFNLYMLLLSTCGFPYSQPSQLSLSAVCTHVASHLLEGGSYQCLSLRKGKVYCWALIFSGRDSLQTLHRSWTYSITSLSLLYLCPSTLTRPLFVCPHTAKQRGVT